MVFGIAFGLGLGTVAGLSVGPYLFGDKMLKAGDYHHLDRVADELDEIAAPEDGMFVTDEMRSLLPHAETWTWWPDYERCSVINGVVATMWPFITESIVKEVIKQATTPGGPLEKALQDNIFKKFPFVEDIVLGPYSLNTRKAEQPSTNPDGSPCAKFDFSAWVADKDFTVGSKAVRIGGMKVYSTPEDELLMETAVMWGSDAKFDIGVFLKHAKFPIRLYVPLEVSCIHFKVHTRINITPLVETFPCVGGATVSLLSPPTVDLSVKLIKGVDLMALPFVPQAVNSVISMVLGKLLLYPNSMSFPIMPKFGVPPPARGALRIVVKGLSEPLKGGSDMYVALEVRKGRAMHTSTKRRAEVVSDPKMGREAGWDEEYSLVVDEFETQHLHVRVFEDDTGFADTLLAEGKLRFGQWVDEYDADNNVERVFRKSRFLEAPAGELVEVDLKGRKTLTGSAIGGTVSAVKGTGSIAKSLAKSVARDKSAPSEAGPGPGALSTAPPAAPGATMSLAASGPPILEEMDNRKVVSRLTLRVTFVPFNSDPKFDDQLAESEALAKQRKKSMALMPSPVSRVITMKFSPDILGVLTVTLVRCQDLVDNDNIYVKLLVQDKDRDDCQTSRCIQNDNSPRWGDKFDFVMICAGATLYVDVLNKAGALSGLFKKKETRDTSLGKLTVPVKDVVVNGRIKDVWTLQDTQAGIIELALQWTSCSVAGQ